MKIAWLMLSLSFRFHSVCPDVTSVSPSFVTAGPSSASAGSPSTIQPTVNNETEPGVKPNGSAAYLTQTTAAVTTVGITAAKTTAVPHVSTQTQPQPSVINNISIYTAPSAVANPTATFSSTKALIPATTAVTAATTVTADSGGSSVGSTNTVREQTPEASVSTKNSRTESSVTLTENSYHVEPSKITKVSTVATTGQTSVTHRAINFKMSNGVEDTEKTTVPVTTNRQTASRATEPTGKPGTTGTLPILTTTGSVVPENLSGTTYLQTTTSTAAAATTQSQPKIFQYSLNSRQEKDEDKDLVEVCKRLMANFQDGNCTLILGHKNGNVQFDCVEINGKVKTSLTAQYYEEISKKPPDNKTLIAILASCGALLIMIFILAICASHHRRPCNENQTFFSESLQQHLTEELHTVENGYHDNPTLEVMEVQAEMQEKKMSLNREFNDSWIVPIDNLLKEDILDEEDTHL
ncbi:podocalyxin isoform X1 [Scophthalmus maximus]|uniref:Podocalyxin n=1 Tax=Scophthalmus maximus TaxID=52904 RepID=A0A8D3AX43_SCOMX|nr:podocalyxin isoform X1 [Scophthalmus maximus]